MRCEFCGGSFSSEKPWAKYCTPRCQNAGAYRKRKMAQSALLDSFVRNRARANVETAIETVQAHEVPAQPAEPFRRRLVPADRLMANPVAPSYRHHALTG